MKSVGTFGLLMSKSNPETEKKPSWVDYFRVSFDFFNGYVSTVAEANSLIREYELATTTSFVSTRDTGKFGENDRSKNLQFIHSQRVSRGKRVGRL